MHKVCETNNILNTEFCFETVTVIQGIVCNVHHFTLNKSFSIITPVIIELMEKAG